MRERLAVLVALFSGGLILLAVFAFGALQNRADGGTRASLDPAQVAAGNVVFESAGCALCHSTGQNKDENPLGGIGARLNATQLRQHIAPGDAMKARFPEAVFEAKQAYHDLAAADMDALIAYLESLP